MKKNPEVSIVLPAFNEEGNIHETISLFEEELAQLEYEILVVDDGSSDRTSHCVETAQQSNPRIQLLKHTVNMGYGATLRTGFEAATGDWTFFTDSDLQFHPQDFHRLWNCRQQFEVVIGYRNPRKDPMIRKINAYCWGGYVRWMFGLRVRDLNCAFKLFRSHLLDQILLESNGAFINAELLVQLHHQNIQFREIPVEHFARSQGQQTGANPSVILSAFEESLRLRHRLR